MDLLYIREIRPGVCRLKHEACHCKRDMQLVIAKGICILSLQKGYVAYHCKRDM